MNVHGDALCFMAKTWARQKTTETVLNNGWRLAVGGWRLVAVGGRRLVAVGGGRRLAVGGPWGLSLTKKKSGFLKTALPSASPVVRTSAGDGVKRSPGGPPGRR